MIITLIGMSGVGKTHWAKQLEFHGFRRFSADDHIEDKLRQELSALGYKGIGGAAEWMGQRYEERHTRTSQQYLGFERDVMLTVLARLGRHPNPQHDLVIDTTGSVIYLPDGILRALAPHGHGLLSYPILNPRRDGAALSARPQTCRMGQILQPDRREPTSTPLPGATRNCSATAQPHTNGWPTSPLTTHSYEAILPLKP